MGKRKTNLRYFMVTVLLLNILVQQVHGCIGGRYGVYDNWPSKGDWEELLLLLTGKYGNGGWGWQSTDSYAYNSIGDYPFGTSAGSSSAGGSNGFFTSSAGTTSFFGSTKNSASASGISSGSSVNTNKMKKALSDYFNSHKNHHISTANVGGVGQVFIDSPGSPPYTNPGPPPYSNQEPSPFLNPSPSPYLNSGPPPFSNYRDEGPPLPAGPPYDSSPPLSSWSGDTNSLQGPPDSPYQWPPPAPVKTQTYQGPSPTVGFNHNSNYNSVNTNRHKNIFQTDHEVFGTKKRRRNGKRRWRNPPASAPAQDRDHGINGQAGLPIKPKKPKNLKRIPFKRRNNRKQRSQDRRGIARRKLKTSFGGYKLDYSRFRFW